VWILLLPESSPRDVLAAEREQQRNHGEQSLAGSNRLIDHRYDLVRHLSAADTASNWTAATARCGKIDNQSLG
jgi:hypothetical protein